MFATYAMLFALPPSRSRRILEWLSYAVACASAIYIVAGDAALWTLVVDPAVEPALSGSAAQFIQNALPFALPVLCIALTIVAARGEQRARLVWAATSLGFFYVVQFAVWTLIAVSPSSFSIGILIVDISIFIAPIGLTYSVLNRRLLDIGFAINRAAVFSGVSVVDIGALLALVLGLSIRAIHTRIDHMVDNVFFRKRHEDERAIRKFAHEAAYITDADTLLHRTVEVLQRNADASLVSLALDDHGGHYGDVSENDPAIVAMRAWHAVLDLDTVDSSLSGEFAFPMIARGRLVGALVLGPKRS